MGTGMGVDMGMDAKVQILLSTWNGERWLPELLESLERQSFQDWDLLIRDDGSQDQTNKLLLEWQRAHPHKVKLFEVDGQHLGSAASFSRLVSLSSAPYLMFCDQDDIWFPEKIELSMAAMGLLESGYGHSKPLLVHTDMAVVNADKDLLAASFWRLRGFDVAQRKQAYLIANVVSGCASLFNRAAAGQAFPLPDEAIQHDRWLALVCAWQGQVHPLAQPLMFYRQHGQNELGADAAPFAAPRISERVIAWSRQAEAFLGRFGAKLSPTEYRLVAALAELQYLKGWERRRHILQHRLFRQGILANLALLLFA